MPFEQPNLTLETILSCARESEQGVESAPVIATAPTDALNIHSETNPVQIDARRITVQDITGSFTKDSDLIGRKLWPVTFQQHLYGVGDAGSQIEPNWIRLVEACGHSVASGSSGGSSSYVLTPASTNITSLTFHQNTADTLTKVLGALGTGTLDFPAGDAPNWAFNFMGEFVTPTSVTYPATIVKQTKVVKLVQSLGLVIGSLTPRASSIRMDFGGTVNEREDVNSPEGIYGLYIGDRNPTLDILLEAPEDQPAIDLGSGVSLWDALVDATVQNISWTHGTNANNFKTAFAWNGAQLVAKRWEEVNRRRMIRTTWKGRNATAHGEYTITHTEKHA